MPTVLSLPFWLPVAWSSMTDCAPCPRVSAPFTACSAARRSLSVSLACFRVWTLLSRAPPAAPESARVRPEDFCSTVWVCVPLSVAAVMLTFFPASVMSCAAIRSEPWTLRSLPALSVTLPFTEPIVLPRWVVSCAVSVTFRLWLP